MDVSIFGLGYVGTVCAACLSGAGRNVIGVDVNHAKIDAINAGHAPIVEPEVSERIAAAVAAGQLRATTSAKEAVLASDVSLVCVGTPSRANGSLDLAYLERVCEEIGESLKEKETPHLVVIRSTVLPGTLHETVIPALEKSSGRSVGDQLGVASNPEFLRESTAVADFFGPPSIVVGATSPEWSARVLELYEGIDAPIIETEIPIAELVKYTANSFHALKVAFANEVGAFAKSHGIDSHAVMDIFCRDEKLNISRAYLKPGFAFGGSCLPKDLRAICHQSKMRDVATPVLDAILESNTHHIGRLVDAIQRGGRCTVGFMGMTFKRQTDDLRESPYVEVIERLLGKGYPVLIRDRYIAISRLMGANREYIEEHVPHLASRLVDTLDELVERCDVLVIAHAPDDGTKSLLHTRPDQRVIDLVRLPDPERIPAQYEGLVW
jgi:GDP-mannose 6-dehydrogenase